MLLCLIAHVLNLHFTVVFSFQTYHLHLHPLHLPSSNYRLDLYQMELLSHIVKSSVTLHFSAANQRLTTNLISTRNCSLESRLPNSNNDNIRSKFHRRTSRMEAHRILVLLN